MVPGHVSAYAHSVVVNPRRNPPNRRNPGHNVGVPDDDWELFGQQCERLGTNRTEHINRFIRWVNHRPDAKPLQRPSKPDQAADE